MLFQIKDEGDRSDLEGVRFNPRDVRFTSHLLLDIFPFFFSLTLGRLQPQLAHQCVLIICNHFQAKIRQYVNIQWQSYGVFYVVLNFRNLLKASIDLYL